MIIQSLVRRLKEIVEQFKRILRAGLALSQTHCGASYRELTGSQTAIGDPTTRPRLYMMSIQSHGDSRIHLEEYPNEAMTGSDWKRSDGYRREGFDPQARYIVRFPCKVNGKEYPIGTQINARYTGSGIIE